MRREIFTKEEKQNIIDLYSSGKVRTLAELARIYSCASLTIRRLLVANQIPIRNKAEAQTKNSVDRFWAKVDVKGKNDCWLWKANSLPAGYGTLSLSGKKILAHRFSWQLAYGKIPDGLCVLHHCDNPPCVNPNHLFIGSPADNVQDMIEKGRDPIQKGELNPKSKLKDEDIPKIKEILSQGFYQKEIASLFGVSSTTINGINTGRYWSHI